MFSFDASLSTARDRVRFFLGDTINAGHLVENETIEAVLVGEPEERNAAAQIALSLAASYARKTGVTKRIGGTSISYGDVAKELRALAASLQAGADGVITASMLVGGISQADREELLDSSGDRITGAFSLRQMDRDATTEDDGDLGSERVT